MFIDPVTLPIQVIFDAIPLAVQVLSQFPTPGRLGALRFRIEMLVDAFAPGIQAVIDTIALVVQALVDAVTAGIQPVIDPVSPPVETLFDAIPSIAFSKCLAGSTDIHHG